MLDRGEPSSSGNAAGATESRKARRYGFACTPCKTRKVKCSGDQPRCAGCQRSGDVCAWPTNSRSSEAQQARNSHEQPLQREVSPERQGDVPPSLPAQSNASHSPAMIESSVRPGNNTNGQLLQNNPRPPITASSVDTPASTAGTNVTTNRPSSTSSRRRPRSRSGLVISSGSIVADASMWYQVGIGEDGTVTYNGPTSRFHARALPQSIDDGYASEGHDDEGHNERDHFHGRDGDDRRSQVIGDDGDDDYLDNLEDSQNFGTPAYEPPAGHYDILRAQYSVMDSVWEPLISAKSTINGTNVDTTTGLALLEIYWTWLHPLHHLVYRPTFIMDLALGGPYCSDFLLLCIFALAARHLPAEKSDKSRDGSCNRGEAYVSQAKTLLIDEMAASSPSIPTIQGLLILGGRQCAIGRSSEGFLYTGMAIRMMHDIGLHLDTSRLTGVVDRWTPAEIETRKRLYNSAYVWDKTMSLALGRPPSLIRLPYTPEEIIDKFDDSRLWKPVHAKEVAESFEPCCSWVTSTSCGFSSLHEITTDMMLLFARRYETAKLAAQVTDLDLRFCRWFEGLSNELRIEAPSELKHSPPPHIVSLNLIYHALHILLRRQILGRTNEIDRHAHLLQCIAHSKQIHEINKLYTRTFPHRLMTYQVSYCIYTAATVEALELKSLSLTAVERSIVADRLLAAVKTLQDEASHTPGSGKSLDTIRRLLSEGSPPVRTQGQSQDPRRRKRMRCSSGDHQSQRDRPADGLDDDQREKPHRDSVMVGNEGQSPRSGTRFPMLADAAGGAETGNAAVSRLEATDADPAVQTYAGGVKQRRQQQQQQWNAATSQPTWYPHQGGSIDGTCHGPEHASTWNSDLGFSWDTDTGAGFHPEAFPWGMTDDFPRFPPIPNNNHVALSAAPMTSAPYPSFANTQGWYGL